MIGKSRDQGLMIVVDVVGVVGFAAFYGGAGGGDVSGVDHLWRKRRRKEWDRGTLRYSTSIYFCVIVVFIFIFYYCYYYYIFVME